MRELSQIVATAQNSANGPALLAVKGSATSRIEFTIPEHVRGLALADLPRSGRLAHVLESMDVCRLGQLHGRAPSEFLGHRNCGRTTIAEIRELISRAASGEFDAVALDRNRAPSEMLKLIEDALVRLAPRDRDSMLDWLGRPGFPPQNLAQIGLRRGLTRERVRQIVEKAVASIRVMWGPRIPGLLNALRERCLSAIHPLTPDVLAAWLGEDLAESTLTPPAQLRLIGLLDEMMPCWPDARDGIGRPGEKASLLEKALREVLLSAGGRLSLADAFRRVRQQRGQTGLDASVFLARLRRPRRLIVEFPDPEHPVLRLVRASAASLAASVLAESDRPLTAKEIHRLAIQRFGPDTVRFEARSLCESLSGIAGVYTVGSGLYGTQSHFHLPPRKWKSVRNAFVRLLAACRT